MSSFFVGVDVGTGSARAALVTAAGHVVTSHTCPIQTWNEQADFFEQSSEDIWTAVCTCVKRVSDGVTPDEIKGIGFDATCSLVAIDHNHQPITVSPSGNHQQIAVAYRGKMLSGVAECFDAPSDNNRNIILWLDHRAGKQAARINAAKPSVLKYVGGAVSLEMQTPKLMWLNENLNQSFKEAKYFFDLPDFLTWKASGDDTRSLCSVVCKWTFVAGPDFHAGWDPSYFKLAGLEELLANDAAKIGSRVACPGASCGTGLTPEAAAQLGLHPGTPVAASLIDAHAGGLGLLGCSASGVSPEFTTRIGLICGTSTCHMAVAEQELLVPGVWGPYYSAMVPQLWLSEAGQSATGKLLDHIVDSHPATAKIQEKLNGKIHLHQHLNKILKTMTEKEKLESPSQLTKHLHVWPDFHGNRSPLADPSLLGMISGLTLSTDEEDLALKYLATIQALAYGTRHIIDTLRKNGHKQLESVLLCGGLSKNPIFVQTHADVLGLPVLLPNEPESVLLGAAMLAAVASGQFDTVQSAVTAMGGSASMVAPNVNDIPYHNKKYKVFLKMVTDQQAYDAIMNT